MVRSAAKNFEDVAIVTAVADYDALTAELVENKGSLTRATRWRPSARCRPSAGLPTST